MSAFLNIVCPVDFSEHARTALAYAVSLADHFQAQLHVIAVRTGDEEPAPLMDQLERFSTPMTSRAGSLHPKPMFVVRSGIPGDIILRLAEEYRAELVVISTHGAGAGIGPRGSTALFVMQHGAVPLLIVPPALHRVPPLEAERLLSRHSVVLAPVDFDLRARRDIRIASGLAQAFGLDLLLLHVLSAGATRTAAQAEAQLRQLAGEIDQRVRTEVKVAVGNAAEEIGSVAGSSNAGVIVMGLRGDRRARGSLPGSIAFGVLNRAPSLVLALPDGPAWIAVRRTAREYGALSGV